MGPRRSAEAPAALPERMQAWLAWLATQRRVSPLTLTAYRAGLQALLRLAEEHPPESLQPADIRRFVARLHGEGQQGRSIARHLSAWRGFYRWLVREHGVRINPALGIRPPKSPSTLPRVLSPEQANALLDPEPQNLLEIRDIAMFELFYSSGLRVAELAGLDIDSGLDLAEGLVTVTGKRQRQRTVPVGGKAIAALRHWLEIRAGLAAAGERALFVTRDGHRLSTRGIASRLGTR
ncbi:MAG: site-specific integrase, partial [Thauera sp.]|nr:site-specific integrase [Thauera sp.]